MSLTIVFKQEDGLANSLDDIHVRFSADNYQEIKLAIIQFMKEYNKDPPNKGQLFDWYLAETEDIFGLRSYDSIDEHTPEG